MAKIIGVTVGTSINPQAAIEKTIQAEQIAQNTRDIEELRTALTTNISEVAELVGGDA